MGLGRALAYSCAANFALRTLPEVDEGSFNCARCADGLTLSV